MGLSLKPQHLKRYKDVALLLIKYGRRDLVSAAGLDPTLADMARTLYARNDPLPEGRPSFGAWILGSLMSGA